MKKPPILLLYNISPYWSDLDVQTAEEVAITLSKAMEAEGYSVTRLQLKDGDLESVLKPFPPEEFIVFNWCEEIPGIIHSYDLVARTLEIMGFTFTGSDSLTLSFSQDKRLVKKRLVERGVPTPDWKIISSVDQDGWNKFPAIVKPALEHCSYGITSESIAFTPAELSKRVEYVLDTFHQPALVEEFIDGREFHVGVVGNGKLKVLPVAEMDYTAIANIRERLCSYESKYDPESKVYNQIRLNLPAPLTPAEKKTLAKCALLAYSATSCRDYARLDIRSRNGEFYVLDVNPNADLSPDTSLVLSAEKAGFNYGQFGSLLAQLASQRHPVYGNSVKLWQKKSQVSLFP